MPKSLVGISMEELLYLYVAGLPGKALTTAQPATSRTGDETEKFWRDNTLATPLKDYGQDNNIATLCRALRLQKK